MARGFGIAGLVLAVLSTFAFYGFNFAAIWLAMILCSIAILNGERALSIASLLIAAAGLLIFSPMTMGTILNDAHHGHSAMMYIGFLPFAFPILALIIDVVRRHSVAEATPQTAMAPSMGTGMRTAEPGRELTTERGRMRAGPIVAVVLLVAAIVGGFFLYQNERVRRAIDVLIGVDHAAAPAAPTPATSAAPPAEHAATPEIPKPNAQPQGGDRSAEPHMRVSTFRRGVQMTVRNFLADDDVITLHGMRDPTATSYSLGSVPNDDVMYQFEPPRTRSIPTSRERGYEITYTPEERSFSVFIYRSPAGDFRRAMMTDLAKRLGIARSKLCDVLMMVWITGYSDSGFGSRNVGLYRCGGADALPGDPEFVRPDSKPGLTGSVRTSFVEASIASCTKTAQQRNPTADTGMIVQYCVCYSNRMADVISPAEVQAFGNTPNDAARMEAALHSRILAAAQACQPGQTK